MAAVIDFTNFRPLRDVVFVTDLDRGARKSAGGLILMDDDMRAAGIRCRWAKVYMVGPDADDYRVGEWILLEHGRWTNGFDVRVGDTELRLWRIDNDAALMASDCDPRDALPM